MNFTQATRSYNWWCGNGNILPDGKNQIESNHKSNPHASLMETQTKCYLLNRENRSSKTISSYCQVYNQSYSPLTFELVWLIFKWMPAVLFYISQPNPLFIFCPDQCHFKRPTCYCQLNPGFLHQLERA